MLISEYDQDKDRGFLVSIMLYELVRGEPSPPFASHGLPLPRLVLICLPISRLMRFECFRLSAGPQSFASP